MANFMEDASHCAICQRLTSTLVPEDTFTALSAKLSQDKGKSYLWTYLYHKNIPETSPSSRVVTKLESQAPKLTFSLSIGSTLGSDSNQDDLSIELCKECCKELETLHKLHQELQNVKEKIQSQVNRINNRATNFHLAGNHLVQLIRDVNPAPEVSMNGVVSGKENVSKSLQFLHQLCTDLAPSTFPTSPENPTIPIPTPNVTENLEACTVPIILSTQSIGIIQPEVCLIKTNQQIDLPIITPPINSPEEENDIFVNQPSVSIIEEDEESRIDIDQTYHEPESDDKQETTMDPLAEDNPPKISRSSSNWYSCDLCGKRFSLQMFLKKHRDSAHAPPERQCSVCGKMVKRQQYVKHMWRHRGGKRLQCQYCERVFTETDTLRKHLVSHTGEKSFSCQNCGRAFTTKQSVNRHMQQVHGSEYNEAAGVTSSDPTPVPAAVNIYQMF